MEAADGGESSRTQDLSRELNQVREYPHGHFMDEHPGTANSTARGCLCWRDSQEVRVAGAQRGSEVRGLGRVLWSWVRNLNFTPSERGR